jgi:SAM-dependent methyltransferase
MSSGKAYFNELARLRKPRRLNAYYWKEISEYISYFAHEDSSVLEIGCGNGDLLARIPASVKTGIDFSESFIEWAREKNRGASIEFLVMDVNHITLTGKYDLIILSNLIGYVDDIQHVFNQIRKCCHENTKVIVQYYNTLWEPFIRLAEKTGLKKPVPAQNWLGTRDINNLLYLSGFDVYRNSRRLIFPLYIPFLSRVLNQYVARLPLINLLGLNIYSFARPLSSPSSEDLTRKYTVSVVIPARNESGNIENAILRMPDFSKKTEIIFVEGNSTDNTWDTIQLMQQKYRGQYDIRIAQQDGKGKADAVRKGFSMANGDILMILDADLTVPPEDLVKFYDAIAGGKGDFINGTRLVYPMEKGAMRFLNYLGNLFFSQAFSWLLDQRFRDTLCGTKVMFRSEYQKLIKNRSYFGDFDPFGDFDLLFGAHKLNLKIMEVPIRYRERTYGETNISRFRHGLILLRMCLFACRKCKFI